MSAPEWRFCFRNLLFYNLLHIPPFVKLKRRKFFYYLINVTLFQHLMRMIVPFLIKENVTFEHLCFLVIFMFSSSRQVLWFLQSRHSSDYLSKVDEFLRYNECSPISDKRNRFMDFWEKQKPAKFTRTIYLINLVAITAWAGQLFYHVFKDVEATKHSFPYWSPYFYSHSGFKYFYTINDVTFSLALLNQWLYLDTVVVFMLSFQRSQLYYLKQLMNEVFDENSGKLSQENIKWWIRSHQLALESAEYVKLILKPLVLVTYTYEIANIVFAVMSMAENANSNQSPAQKVIFTSGMAMRMFQFGIECTIADQCNELHKTIVEKAFKYEVVYGGQWKSYYYKFILSRVQIPIKISGYGFFRMSGENFKDLVYTAFSFYTSLLSLLRRRRLRGQDA